MEPQTNEENYATAKKWSTICKGKQMKHIMRLRTNEGHNENANKWSTLCKCKQMKHTKQMETKKYNIQ
jgi:hypothetical protein